LRRFEIGLNNIMWGNDFPHPEGTWPHTKEWCRETFWDCPVEDTRRILGLNAAEFYNFDVERLAPLVDRIGPTPDEVRQVGVDMGKWDALRGAGRHWLTGDERSRDPWWPDEMASEPFERRACGRSHRGRRPGTVRWAQVSSTTRTRLPRAPPEVPGDGARDQPHFPNPLSRRFEGVVEDRTITVHAYEAGLEALRRACSPPRRSTARRSTCHREERDRDGRAGASTGMRLLLQPAFSKLKMEQWKGDIIQPIVDEHLRSIKPLGTGRSV
jgi:hypothetical protein